MAKKDVINKHHKKIMASGGFAMLALVFALGAGSFSSVSPRMQQASLLALSPGSVITYNPDNLTDTSATLFGGAGLTALESELNVPQNQIRFWFNYSLSPNYFPVNGIPTKTVLATYDNGSVTKDVSGLTAGTTYYYRLCAGVGANHRCGNTISFVPVSIGTPPVAMPNLNTKCNMTVLGPRATIVPGVPGGQAYHVFDPMLFNDDPFITVIKIDDPANSSCEWNATYMNAGSVYLAPARGGRYSQTVSLDNIRLSNGNIEYPEYYAATIYPTGINIFEDSVLKFTDTNGVTFDLDIHAGAAI